MLHPTGTINLLINVVILVLHRIREYMFLIIIGLIGLFVIFVIGFQLRGIQVNPADPDSPRLQDYYVQLGTDVISVYNQGTAFLPGQYAHAKQRFGELAIEGKREGAIYFHYAQEYAKPRIAPKPYEKRDVFEQIGLRKLSNRSEERFDISSTS